MGGRGELRGALIGLVFSNVASVDKTGLKTSADQKHTAPGLCIVRPRRIEGVICQCRWLFVGRSRRHTGEQGPAPEPWDIPETPRAPLPCGSVEPRALRWLFL
ncbi:hypothetical protein AAFF_G00171880 [Aldrovandia affinis]|uniref:Uncharacterized protein n=1 Tax=Aldrovandia affinis TaxID=143900 RepID=A0AAD7SYL1_9TELE|nr:hypothetical protein AAFF_G00171880 [Aldrovandia affinis]